MKRAPFVPFATALALLIALSLGLACGKSAPEAGSDPAAKPKATASGTSGAGADNGGGAAGTMGPLLADDQVRIVEAPSGDDVVAIVREERARHTARGRSIIVYEGAKWCEPCQYFHKAAAAG
jgi:hypothetical protein